MKKLLGLLVVVAAFGWGVSGTALGDPPQADRDVVVSAAPAEAGSRVILQTPDSLKVSVTTYTAEDKAFRVLLGFTDSTRSWEFEVRTNAPRRPLNAEDFRWMWGTATGTSALLAALADMTKGQAIAAPPLDVAKDGIKAPVAGVAVFEHNGELMLLMVTVDERGGVQKSMIGPIYEARCSATVPGHDCSCSASGKRISCRAWTDSSTGTAHAQCSDETGTVSCNGKDGSCSCQSD